MNKIGEMIELLCPEGVEHKALREVDTATRGGNFQKKDFTEKGLPLHSLRSNSYSVWPSCEYSILLCMKFGDIG